MIIVVTIFVPKSVFSEAKVLVPFPTCLLDQFSFRVFQVAAADGIIATFCVLSIIVMPFHDKYV